MKESAGLTLAMAAVIIVAACGSGVDTERNVREALDGAGLPHVDLAVDEDTNIVHLQGTVGTLAERARAEEIAEAAVGTTGRVLNELTVAGLNDDTAGALDDEIEDAVEEMIERDLSLRERDIEIDVANGMVAVTGQVRTADEKGRVTEIVRAAPGVKDVANGLAVDAER